VLAALLAATAAGSAPVAAQADTLYKCETGANFVTFDADSRLVDQVCPAHSTNYSTEGMSDSGELYIVIHNTATSQHVAIQGNINAFQQYYSNVDERRSSQYIVGLNETGGAHVIQLVREDHVAYHAGGLYNRTLNGKTIDNENSIGIEVVGIGDLDGWPRDAVYQKVAELVLDIVDRAKQDGRTIELTRGYIVGHEEINKGAKSDPGQQWDWQRFMVDYLHGTYEPAMDLQASTDETGRMAGLKVVARANGRDGFWIERRQDSGSFVRLSAPVKNVSRLETDNPATIALGTDTPPFPKIPSQFCYRAIAYKGSTDYANPSDEACVSIGIADAQILDQSRSLILLTGEAAVLTATLQNTGNLDWLPEPRYGLRLIDGAQLGPDNWKRVGTPVPADAPLAIELPIVAPAQAGSYASIWQMVYVDPATDRAVPFGPEIRFTVIARPQDVIDLGLIGLLARLLLDGLIRLVEDQLRPILEPILSIIRPILALINELLRLLRSLPVCGPLFAAPLLVAFVRRSRIGGPKRGP
jgi:N-acetyl-anhydromuramyl-L-alanine amidase AmpD